MRTAKGFTMLPNFVLKSPKLTAGDKMTFAMLLSYAGRTTTVSPARSASGKTLAARDQRAQTPQIAASHGLLAIRRRGQGKTNIYELNLKPRRI